MLSDNIYEVESPVLGPQGNLQRGSFFSGQFALLVERGLPACAGGVVGT